MRTIALQYIISETSKMSNISQIKYLSLMGRTVGILVLLLVVVGLQAAPKDVYVVDFHNDKQYNSILGNNVANEFERSLSLCKSKYRIIPRIKYQRELHDQTFEATKRFLATEGIDYIIYGNIYRDDVTNMFTIEYIFEEISTRSIILIESINFSKITDLLNTNNRYETIQEKLKADEELCKRFSSQPSRAKVIDEGAAAKDNTSNTFDGDDDNDGVPNSIDKEPNTPIGAMVDARGVEVKDENAGDWKDAEREAILKLLPDMPNIPFEAGTAEIPVDAYMKVDQMANLMKMYPVIVVELQGTDPQDEALAQERARILKDYLMKSYRLPERRFVTSYKVDAAGSTQVVSRLALEKMDF